MVEQHRDVTDKKTDCPEVHLRVKGHMLPFFTTILQYGIVLETIAGTTIGSFLGSCPGFSREYLTQTVQTIFLNGNAVDSMEMVISGNSPVIALSAAMPGLAGAIFRKNGPHGSLRTTTRTTSAQTDSGPLLVTIKLFNQIARDKGVQLLAQGVLIAAPSVAKFLQNRAELIDSIDTASIDGTPATPEQLSRLSLSSSLVRLCIGATDNDPL